jgi:hypothetical protein
MGRTDHAQLRHGMHVSRPRLTLTFLLALPLACGEDAQLLVELGATSSSSGEAGGPDTGAVATSSSGGTSAATTGEDGASDGSTTGAAPGTTGTSSGSETDTRGASSTSEATSSGPTGSEGGSTTDAGATTDGGTTTGGGIATTGGTTTEDGGSSGAESSGVLDVGIDPDPLCPLACDPPCEIVLSEGLHGVSSIQHDRSRFAARDWFGKLILRDAESLEVLLVEHDTVWAELTAGVLAVAYDDGSVILRASDDLEVLGETVTAAQRGLAIDGSYLWAAGPAGIDVLAVDGSPMWSMVGDFSAAQVLALPDSLHVFADGFDGENVLHVDLAGGITEQSALEGNFAGWFGDLPRYWSQQGMAYRLYESDGTELAFGVGSIVHGWGDHLVLNGAVVHISDVATPLLSGLGGYVRRSGPALAIYGATSQIIVLDAMGPLQEAFPTACCSPPDSYGWQFGWSPTGWVIGRSDGVVGDQLDRTMSMGPIERIDVAIGGRFTLLQPGSSTAVWDLTDDCRVEPVGEIDIPGGAHELSPDGSVIASGIQDPDFLEHNSFQTLLHALPDGSEIGYFGNSGCSHCFIQRWNMADDASLLGFNWDWTGAATSGVVEVPGGTELSGLMTNVLPAIAPAGQNWVMTQAGWGPGASYEDSVAYVYDGADFVDVFDGVAWGFIDDEHLLLSHYESAGDCQYAGGCDTFLGTDIVELDGDVVQATTLPDVREFQRISATEIFVIEPPRIFDVYTGELLWSIPDTDFAGAISSDLVVSTDGASLVVHRWR